MSARVLGLGRRDSWEGIAVVVAGMGVSGFAAADNLTHLGASVTGLDDAEVADSERATLLEILGVTLRCGPGSADVLPDQVDVVIASPGWAADAPLIAQAVGRGVPVWGEVELAWRLRDPENPAPWLAVAGAGSTVRPVRMLEQMLLHGGLRTIACGNVGLPVVEAVMTEDEDGRSPYDVLAVDLSAAQLRSLSSMAAHSAAVLSATGPAAADLGRVYEGVERACVYNVADPATERLVRDAEVQQGARAIGFTLGMPSVGMVGLVEDVLVDRAFVENRRDSAAELCTLSDLASPDPLGVQDALGAAALARSFDVAPVAVRDALRAGRAAG